MKDSPTDGKSRKNWLEWSVFAASSVLVLSVFGVLIFLGFKEGDAPPLLVAIPGVPLVSGGQVRVPVKVYNRGDQAAAAVMIEVTGAGGEKADFTLEIIPAQGMRKGWAVFRGDKIPAGLSSQVLGYEEP